MLPTISVANYFIGKGIESGIEVTPMKLIKLVYVAHGWYLGNYKERLIGEAVEAWKYGPVIPSLYHSFKQYRNSNITQQKAVIIDGSEDPIIPMPPERTSGFLDDIWENYKHFTGIELSSITHKDDTPWYKIWYKEGGGETQGSIISTDLIRSHYKEKLRAFYREECGEEQRNGSA